MISGSLAKATVKGVTVRASRPRQGRRIVRKRDAALQEEVREVGHPLGAEEAAALREAERQAQAQGDPGAQEDAAQARRGTAGDPLDHSFRPSEGGEAGSTIVIDIV